MWGAWGQVWLTSCRIELSSCPALCCTQGSEDTKAFPQNKELEGGESVSSAVPVQAGRKTSLFPLCWA